MESQVIALLPLGAVLLASLALEAIGRRTRLPRVTLLILFGVVAGPGGLGWVTPEVQASYPLVAVMALGLIGFLLGGSLTGARLRALGRLVAWVSLLQVAVTYAVVALGLVLLSFPPPLALLCAAIATATDPAAVRDVIAEMGEDSPFAQLLRGVVAIDDAWGLIVFSLTLVAVHMLLGAEAPLAVIRDGFWELGGSVLLGVGLGAPVAYASGRLRESRPLLVEGVGAVFLCVGLAEYLQVSYLLACVVMGATVANLARHHKGPFRVLQDIEWPFAILFFVMSGTLLQPGDIGLLGDLGIAYIALRVGGRLVGGWLAGMPAWTGALRLAWMGPAMLPQAGVAMAMAYVAAETLPQYEAVVPVVVASTVLFELMGPVGARFALRHAGRSPGSSP